MSNRTPGALLRLVREFCNAEPDARNSGIAALKSGYHNSRENHLHPTSTNGGHAGDYSIQLAVDRLGAADCAAAVDISFDTARLHGDFRIIAKYSTRLMNAFKARDPRLFYKGKAVVREFFGNTDLDRTVEGWSLLHNRAVSSDPSHQWHIHISFHRAYVENFDAVKGVLDVLLARTPKPPVVKPPTGDDMTQAQFIAFFKAALQDPEIRQELGEVVLNETFLEYPPGTGAGGERLVFPVRHFIVRADQQARIAASQELPTADERSVQPD
jgi:hypothetical protein